MTFTVVPSGPSSTAAIWPIVCRKAPAVAASAAPCTGRTAGADETRMMRGSPRRAAACVARNASLSGADRALPVGLRDLEERLLRLLAGAGDGRVEGGALLERRADRIAGRARQARDRDRRHQYFPTTKPPSTRR